MSRPAAGLDDVVQVVATLAAARVARPDRIRIEPVRQAGGGVLLRIHAAPEDLGRLVGKAGRTVKVLREVAGTLAAQLGLPPVLVDVHGTGRNR